MKNSLIKGLVLCLVPFVAIIGFTLILYLIGVLF